MTLTGKQKNYLRGLAHNRKPVVTVGNAGATAAVIAELDAALSHHELVKIKLPAAERGQRMTIFSALCEATGAIPVQQIGRIAVAYRAEPEPKLVLP